MKVFWCRFHKSLGLFNMLIVKGISETVFFKKSGLTNSFIVCNFRNKVAMTIIFFFENVQISMYIPDMEQKDQKKFLILKIIAFAWGTTNFHNFEEDTCHWQSICYETPVRFTMSLREIFPESGSLWIMKRYDESALMQILQKFGTL